MEKDLSYFIVFHYDDVGKVINLDKHGVALRFSAYSNVDAIERYLKRGPRPIGDIVGSREIGSETIELFKILKDEIEHCGSIPQVSVAYDPKKGIFTFF